MRMPDDLFTLKPADDPSPCPLTVPIVMPALDQAGGKFQRASIGASTT